MEDMIYVGLLATEPASQGKGYGGALLEVINDFVSAIPLINSRHYLPQFSSQADELSKATWLISSNTLNDPFYNSH